MFVAVNHYRDMSDTLDSSEEPVFLKNIEDVNSFLDIKEVDLAKKIEERMDRYDGSDFVTRGKMFVKAKDYDYDSSECYIDMWRVHPIKSDMLNEDLENMF